MHLLILLLPSPPSLTYFPAENLTEYKWPPDDTGEYYMLQEQVSEYLGVTSFKRKYPGKKEHCTSIQLLFCKQNKTKNTLVYTVALQACIIRIIMYEDVGWFCKSYLKKNSLIIPTW